MSAQRLPPLPTIKEIIRLYKLRARKQLSQNFLLDLNLTRKIVRAAGSLEGHHVCEVGPGPGGITRAILESGIADLRVIEKDVRFMPGLQLLNDVSGGKMRIFNGDILRFNMDDLFPTEATQAWDDSPPKIHIIGNLPFNVSTPLIINWLEAMSERTSAWKYGRVKLTLTFQKEVAERMVAPILNRQRCRLSVMCQYLCYVQHKFTIPGTSFVPPPDVDVGIVKFVPLKQPKIALPFRLVEKVVRHVFHFRQKMCKRGIATLFPPDQPALTREMLSTADVSPDTRPFMLDIAEIDRLCHVYKDICDRHPGLIDYNYRSAENALDWRRAKLPLNI
ncbi:hypothetical protein NP493_214g01019 [Ridgeia piscesae]|uniref:rRNA adenine N(6)-methyltransferase n=1 Tax=Ridgeia piscesae TaxID=27915 RepID=A0AAD9P0U9_RIDPI|nr:hypothetical protein NP493_214g01019 [Ridgeia piscesae]